MTCPIVAEVKIWLVKCHSSLLRIEPSLLPLVFLNLWEEMPLQTYSQSSFLAFFFSPSQMKIYLPRAVISKETSVIASNIFQTGCDRTSMGEWGMFLKHIIRHSTIEKAKILNCKEKRHCSPKGYIDLKG